MQVRPLVAVRLGLATAGVVALACGMVLHSAIHGVIPTCIAVALVVTGLGVFFRSFWLRVVVDPAHVRIHGLLRTRRIPRAAVTELTEFPALRWTDETGRRHWSPIVGLMMSGPRMMSGVTQHNQTQVRALRKALKIRKPKKPRPPGSPVRR